jgi:predicted O-linked N-acetylglucosamine transferase (SPINDLY family)
VVHLFEDSDPLTPTAPWQGVSDRHCSLPHESLLDAQRTIADQKLDVLIHTPCKALRYFLSHARLAPVQCVVCEPSYTDGIPNLDYYISWAPAEPTDPEKHYTSPVALMNRPPYWVEQNYTKPAELRRQDFDLPQDAHWYVCPGSPLKMHPKFDTILADILATDKRGLLILIRGDYVGMRVTEQRLRAVAGRNADRIRILPTLPSHRCHALLAAADAVIDTWPQGGMSSSWVSLHGGIPTVTLPIDMPFGRWLPAMYEKIGVTDLIATDPKDFARVAVRLANEPEWRKGIAARIKAGAAMFIEDRLAVRELESFLQIAAKAAHRGEPPRHWRNGQFVAVTGRSTADIENPIHHAFGHR